MSFVSNEHVRQALLHLQESNFLGVISPENLAMICHDAAVAQVVAYFMQHYSYLDRATKCFAIDLLCSPHCQSMARERVQEHKQTQNNALFAELVDLNINARGKLAFSEKFPDLGSIIGAENHQKILSSLPRLLRMLPVAHMKSDFFKDFEDFAKLERAGFSLTQLDKSTLESLISNDHLLKVLLNTNLERDLTPASLAMICHNAAVAQVVAYIMFEHPFTDRSRISAVVNAVCTQQQLPAITEAVRAYGVDPARSNKPLEDFVKGVIESLGWGAKEDKKSSSSLASALPPRGVASLAGIFPTPVLPGSSLSSLSGAAPGDSGKPRSMPTSFPKHFARPPVVPPPSSSASLASSTPRSASASTAAAGKLQNKGSGSGSTPTPT